MPRGVLSDVTKFAGSIKFSDPEMFGYENLDWGHQAHIGCNSNRTSSYRINCLLLYQNMMLLDLDFRILFYLQTVHDLTIYRFLKGKQSLHTFSYQIFLHNPQSEPDNNLIS